MPITTFSARKWGPGKGSFDERTRHVAYHMEHYIRRMPTKKNGRKVQRVCIIMDMRGFKATMLPYVRDCVAVLRDHYPGRLGAACFINVPPYFPALWRIISPWLDEEILGKTFFAPGGEVDDFEDAIVWLDRKHDLPDPTSDPS